MIYFDSAATTLQKPTAVRQAVLSAMQQMSSPGRGGYAPARRAAAEVFACRRELSALFHVPAEEQVIFTSNATHGLNIAIHSLLSSGDQALISGYEHNAVTRPLHSIPNLRLRVAETALFSPGRTLEAFERALREEPQAVICTHVSNVFGDILPIREIAALCRQRGVPLIIDASQSAGLLDIDFQELGAMFIAMPGHKGLYGPQGTGVLLCKDAARCRSLLHGGTGSFSVQQTMPEELPDRLEAGTHNVPGIAGLRAGVRFLRQQGLETVRGKEQALLAQAVRGLRQIPGVRLYAAADAERQSAVLSFIREGTDSETVAQALAERGVCVRGGLHCAPLAHRTAGTLPGGTVRLSLSVFNTTAEVMNFLKIMQEKAW